FASGLVGVRSPYGVPRNSLDPEIVPGGSSSGSAVAIGHGLVTFALGTDTAGSGRVPAALNGIVGLKPSLGALSARGVVPACRTLDTISIFAGSVGDAFKVFQVACAYDAEDAYSKPITPGALGCVPKGLSIGVPSPATREFLSDVAQSDMFDAAIARFIQAGATISEIDFKPFLAVAELLYQGAWVAERYAVVEDLMQTNRDAIHPITAKIIAAAEGLSAADAFRGIYRLRELSRLAQDAMGGVDLLCVPSIPTFYTLADLQADPVTPNSNLGTYTNFVNLLDMCGITVPTGPRADGRPGSVTLLARSGQDALAASVAQVFEDAFETGPTLVPLDMTVLAVCGAHMSGLPLNRELTSRGATMLKRARTAPCYSLYALAGGPPKRPGLLRRENGVEIDVELWMLPDAELASFVSGIPSPLSLGTVLLRDGEKALGFLVEACGVDGAEDISGYGGWRAYLSDSESRKQPALQRL
ncbi:MAG: allophanate hydrolase, partial [Pseudomonadota bacterium]